MDQRKGQKRIVRAAKLWTGAILAAFAASAAVFFTLLQIEKNALADYEKTEAYLAACVIPAGEIIREDQLDGYFQRVEIDSALIPENVLRDPAEAVGMAAMYGIDKGSLLTKGMFQEMAEVLADMEEPVVAGFRAEDLFQVVGGVLRAGDRIHIYSTEEDLGTFLVWEDVYVQQVFDSSGSAIENGDRTTAAQRINIYLDRSEVEQFYTGLEKGSLRVVKVCG